MGRSADLFLNFRGGGVGDPSRFGRGGMDGISGLLPLNDGRRLVRFRVTRLRDGVRKGVKPGCSLVDVAIGGVWKGYSVCSDCFVAGGGEELTEFSGTSEMGVGRNGV